MALSAEQIAQIAYQAGFRGDALVKMVAIAKRESGYNPDAHRTDSDPSKMSGDRGLWQINSANDQTLLKAGIINSKADLLDPVKNAQAAFYLSNGGSNLSPWGAGKGGWKAGGDPTYGTNVGEAQSAVNAAQAKGLLGAAYGAAAGAQQEGPKMIAAEERDAFNSWLKQQPADQQKKIIEDLKTPRSLAEVGAYMQTAPAEVNRYVKFLSTLDAGGQYSEKSLLAAPDPAGSTEMTNMLNTLGVSYSNAPNPTPALLAFLRGIGLNMSTAEDVKRRALERIGASTSDAMADIDRTAGRAKQNITADLVRRNVLQSGESNTRYARQSEDVAAQRSDVQRNATTATEQVEDAYTSARDLARQQALDRIIGAEQDQATQRAQSAAQVDATRAQQQAADDAFARQQAAQEASIKAQEDAMRQQQNATAV